MQSAPVQPAPGPLSDFAPYIVRKQDMGVSFNYIVGDRVAEGWYNASGETGIPVDQARSLARAVDRTAPIGWREMAIMRDHIAVPGSKFVECGSHQGLTTILIASWVGETGFVYAFDAVLFNALVTQRNLELNRITNAAAYCQAIGGSRALVNLHNESNVIATLDAHVSAVSAVMIRIDDVVHGEVDALKLDIEGAELGVLEASAAFVARIPRLAIEVHTDLLPPDGIARLLAALGPRPLHILWEDERFEPYLGQPITARVHLFSF